MHARSYKSGFDVKRQRRPRGREAAKPGGQRSAHEQNAGRFRRRGRRRGHNRLWIRRIRVRIAEPPLHAAVQNVPSLRRTSVCPATIILSGPRQLP
jgi:hypothetical protein